MNASHTKFYLNRARRKWSGVCAGIADYIGTDVLLVRIGVVVLTIAGGFPWTLIAYWLIAWKAPDKPRELALETPEEAKFWQGVRRSPAIGMRDMRSRFRDIDRRLGEVETYVTSNNTSLAREIEQLR